MIFCIKKTITSVPETGLNVFGHALLAAMDHDHYVELDVGIFDWFKSTMLDSDAYLGKLDKELLRESNLWDTPNGIICANLTSVDVGDGQGGTLTPDQMLTIAAKHSVVVLENPTYDWYAYKRWVELYRSDKGMKSVVEKVFHAISNNQLLPESDGGGGGTILNCVNRVKPLYGDMYRYKMTSIFDSDKTSPTDTTDHNRILKKGLEDRGIDYHELVKREVENYFPLSVYQKVGLTKPGVPVPSYTDEEWDYVDFEECGYFTVQKKDVKDLSEVLTKNELDNRIGNNPPVNGQNEVQRVILLLAKYV